jgi:hypothetical protein
MFGPFARGRETKEKSFEALHGNENSYQRTGQGNKRDAQVKEKRENGTHARQNAVERRTDIRPEAL